MDGINDEHTGHGEGLHRRRRHRVACDGVVFTVEYSVRAAMHGVYGLLGLRREIPAIYHGITDPKVALEALKTLMG